MQGYTLSRKQLEYIDKANHRYNLKIGAVRSGKTFTDIVHTVPDRLLSVEREQGLNLILGVSKETIERNILQPMREQYGGDIVGIINNRNIAMVCGVPVYCLGAEKITQVAKIQGMSVKYCYGDEIAKWNPEVFAMLQSRMDKPYSCFDGSCNPEYPGHWLKAFVDRTDIDLYLQKYTIFDNPFLPGKFVSDLCKEYEGTVYYGRYILGEWTLAEGLIYPMYQDAIEQPGDAHPESFMLSVDYGTQNAFAGLLWGKYGGVWYALKEYYYSGRETGIQKTDEEYADDLEAFMKPYSGQRYKTIVDPSAASFITLWQKRGHPVIKADNDVADGIRETATALKKGIVKISPDCVNWKKEVQGYVWDDTAGVDRPVKVNDHCLTGDTIVNTEDGEKRIHDLVGKTGNVWSYNTETGQAELKPFYNVRKTQENAPIYVIGLEDGREIRCTGEHPILTKRGYVEAQKLTDADEIIEVSV